MGWAPQRARRKESHSHLHTFLPTWKRPASFLGLIVCLDAQEEGLPGDFLLLPLLPFPVSQDSEHPLQCLIPMITGFLPPLLQKVAHIASWEHLPHFKMTTIQRANKWSQPSHISLGPDLLSLQPNVFIKSLSNVYSQEVLEWRAPGRVTWSPEAGIKPLDIPADLTSLYLSSSTRELSWARPHSASLFLGLSSGNTFFLSIRPQCFLHRKKDFGCGVLFIAWLPPCRPH